MWTAFHIFAGGPSILSTLFCSCSSPLLLRRCSISFLLILLLEKIDTSSFDSCNVGIVLNLFLFEACLCVCFLALFVNWFPPGFSFLPFSFSFQMIFLLLFSIRCAEWYLGSFYVCALKMKFIDASSLVANWRVGCTGVILHLAFPSIGFNDFSCRQILQSSKFRLSTTFTMMPRCSHCKFEIVAQSLVRYNGIIERTNNLDHSSPRYTMGKGYSR